MKLEAKIKAVPKEPRSYGHINVNSTDFPGVKELEIGTKVSLIVEVEVERLSKADRWEISENKAKPGDINAGMSIRKIELANPKKTK